MTEAQYEINEKVLDLFIEARIESKGVYTTLKSLLLKNVSRYIHEKYSNFNCEYTYTSERMQLLLSYFCDCNERELNRALIEEVLRLQFEEHFKNREIIKEEHLKKVKDIIFGVGVSSCESNKPTPIYPMYYIKDEDSGEWRDCEPTEIGDNIYDNSECKVEFAICEKEKGHTIKYTVESLGGKKIATVSTEYLCGRCELKGNDLTTHCCAEKVSPFLLNEIQKGKADYILFTWLTYPNHSETFEEVQRVSKEVLSYFTSNCQLTSKENDILFQAMDYDLKERYRPTK